MSATVIPARKPFRLKLNVRAETRRALLAAGEACWVYAAVLTLTTLLHFPRSLSPFGIFVAYWGGMAAGRVLPRLPFARWVQQAANLGTAVLIILVVMRLDLYHDAPLLDLAWLPVYLEAFFGFLERFTPDQLATLVVIYAYVRGLGYAQRPLTLWFVAYQFRLGVVLFFLTALVAALLGADFRVWLFVYFAVSLLGISLARIEESGREMALGARWVLVLIGATALVLLLALALTQVFTVEAARAFFEMLAPVGLVLEFLLFLFLIPLSLVVQAIVFLFGPLLRALARALNELKLFNTVASNLQPIDLGKTGDQLAALLPYLRVLALILFVFTLGVIIARALNRRVRQVEEESFAREGLDERERVRAERTKRPRAAARGAREVEAETIRRMYAALLALAAAHGLARRESETPLEFLPRLRARWPEAQADLGALTEAYVAVHYAQLPPSTTKVRAMRAVWQRLRGEMAR